MLKLRNTNSKLYCHSEWHEESTLLPTKILRLIFNRLRMTTFLTCSLSVACFLFFGTFSRASAQEIFTELTVSPPVSYIQIKPGSVSRHTITLQNTGNRTLEVSTSLVDFKPGERTGIPVLSQTNSFPYLDNESKNFPVLTLEPQKKAQLTLQFTVPQFAPEKEYPLTILFSTKTTDPLSLTSAAAVQSTVGSNLIVLVSSKNELDQQLLVTNFGINKVIDSFSPLSAQPVVKNERFSSSVASGSATLKNAFGKTVAEYLIYPDVILGFGERQLRFVKPGTLSAPELTPEPFHYDPTLFLGLYTMTIQLTPTTAIPYSAQFSYTFFALPLILLVALLVAGIVISFYLWHKRKTLFF